mmetsp:Transcript_10908/g.22401  ORF Transcript_10908/g.22401 Transcript_10908/m.22401 type:complete len:278 (-) Transcript_10908:67-900(-)
MRFAILAALLPFAHGFFINPQLSTSTTISTTSTNGRPTPHLYSTKLPTPEESADALRDYMVKSAEVRKKYEDDIKALKKEIDSLKASSTVAPPTSGDASTTSAITAPGDLPSSSFPSTNRDLQKKLADYQAFLSSYIVNSQEEKRRAVKDAEDKIRAFYEAKMTEIALPAGEEVRQIGGKEESLFDMRNKMVAEQGKSGRWISREVERAASVAASGGDIKNGTTRKVSPKASAPTANKKKEMKIDVTEADHGQRADGGVGGPSLAERVNFGSELLKE